MKQTRLTSIENRQVRRATTTNYDIIKQAMIYWEAADFMETQLEDVQLHNTQRRVNVNLIYKLKQLAKGLGHHLDAPNPAAFKTKELTDKLFDQAEAARMAKNSKLTAQSPRAKEQVYFS